MIKIKTNKISKRRRDGQIIGSSTSSSSTSSSSSFGFSGIPNLDKLKIDVYGNLFVPGNVISYADFGVEVGSIFDNLPIASTTSLGISQFSDTQFTVTNGVVTIKDGEVGLNETELNTYLTNNNYATHSWVTSQNYLTSHQDLTGYATETWVTSQNYLTSHQSLTGYATESWVTSNFNNYVHPLTHAASIIAQDSTHRFVTDTEKSTWDSKWNWNATTVAGVKVNNAVLADKAIKLNTARTISLSGDLSGSTSFDGSANKSITSSINAIQGITVEKVNGEDTLVFSGNLVATGNVVGYGTTSTSLGTIFDNLPNASTTSKGVAQFSSSQFTVINGVVSIKDGEVGLNESELATYLANNSYSTKTWVNNNSIKRTGDNVTGNYTFNGNLNIAGNITQNGASYITDAEHINVGSNLAVMNQNETGAGVSTVLFGTSIPFSGWEIERGSEENFYFGFDENIDRFVVGKKGSLQQLTAMDNSLQNGKLLAYNTTNKRLENITEYSAFNKNFGTIAGTVSEGNHTHNYQPKVSSRWVYINDGADDCYLEGSDSNPSLGGIGFGAQITDVGDKVSQNTLWKLGGVDAKVLAVNGTKVSLEGHTHSYLPASGKAVDADKLDGISSGSFLRSDTTDYSQSVNYLRYAKVYADGVPSNNLGDPTLAEMALFDTQFNNKTEFYDISKLKFFTSSDGSNWTEYTSFSDTEKKKFLGGDSTSGINIPNSTPYFRIQLESSGYVYLNALYMYWSSNSHNTTVQIRKKRCDNQTWYQHTSSSTTVSSWPGHLYLPFSSIPFHPSGTSHYDTIHIDFKPNWSTGSYSDRVISLYNMQLWGGYPSGKRKLYTTDYNKNATFPANLSANGNLNLPSGNVEIGTYSTTATGSLILNGSTANKKAVLKCTSGNLHIDAESGHNLYLNYYNGSIIYFGNGATGTTGSINSAGVLSLTNAIKITKDIAGDAGWNDCGIILENTATSATGEAAISYKNAGSAGTGANYWIHGLNQSTILKFAYGPAFEDSYTKFSINTSGVAYLNGNQRIFADNYHPNADKLTTARTISLTGDVTGSVSFDGSANVSITATVGNDSHTHDDRYYTESESNTRYFRRDISNDVDVKLTAGHGRGLRFWDSDSYKIYMSARDSEPYGVTELDTTADYNMYFRMSTANRGFVFFNGSNSSNAAFQIKGDGNAMTRLGFKAFSAGGTGAVLSCDKGTIIEKISTNGGLCIGRDDTVILGAGEAHTTIKANVSATNEYLHLGTDGNAYLYTNMQSGWSSRKTFTFDGSGNFSAPGNITAYSDIRLKDNIQSLTGALNKVNQLRGVTYTRKDQEDKSKVHIGFIAQEVEKVFPELVETHDDEDKTKSVNYQNMVAVLLEAVKELTAEVEDLKKKIR